MPKKQKESNVCPNCGTVVDKPTKTWNLISPLPDAYGRITITVMGSYTCPKCGHKWRAVVSKIKAGDTSVEVEGKRGVKQFGEEGKKEQKRDQGDIIELDLSDLDEEE